MAYMPQHVYIFTPCREPWPAASINARLGKVPVVVGGKHVMLPASTWLDQNRPVECMTWAPGFPTLIKDRLAVDSGWIEREDVTTFRPPRIQPGDASKAGPWPAVRKIYPDDADHIIAWLAHRVQRPGEKINHALVLGGLQGIGKDTLLEPVKHAVGPWNFRDVVPANRRTTSEVPTNRRCLRSFLRGGTLLAAVGAGVPFFILLSARLPNLQRYHTLAQQQQGASTHMPTNLWQLGESGNPTGRLRGSRNKLSEEVEIAPEPAGHGLPLSKCEAYNRVYEQPCGSS